MQVQLKSFDWISPTDNNNILPRNWSTKSNISQFVRDHSDTSAPRCELWTTHTEGVEWDGDIVWHKRVFGVDIRKSVRIEMDSFKFIGCRQHLAACLLIIVLCMDSCCWANSNSNSNDNDNNKFDDDIYEIKGEYTWKPVLRFHFHYSYVHIIIIVMIAVPTIVRYYAFQPRIRNYGNGVVIVRSQQPHRKVSTGIWIWRSTFSSRAIAHIPDEYVFNVLVTQWSESIAHLCAPYAVRQWYFNLCHSKRFWSHYASSLPHLSTAANLSTPPPPLFSSSVSLIVVENACQIAICVCTPHHSRRFPRDIVDIG